MIREYKPQDLAAIKRMHQGKFELPDFEHPLVIVKKCVVDDRDVPRLAAFGRLHVDAMLFVDHAYRTPTERFEELKELHAAMFQEAGEKGLDVATAQMEGRFAERMKALGWIRGSGDLYYHDL